MKKNKQNIISTSPSEKDSFIKSFFSKLKRLQYSFVQIFFKEKEKPEQISSLAAKVLKSKKEIDKIRPYLNRLNSALSSEGITNIALTGTYGSGKSTVIRTFQDIHKAEDPNNDFDYLNISLASFKDEIIDEEESKSQGNNNIHFQQSQDNFERLLEVSILQQMIYHVKPSRIPDSRFKRIINLTNKKLIVTALGFVIWLISALSMWKFGVFSKINPLTWTFSFKDLDFTSFLIIGIFLSGLANIIFRFIRTFGNSRISKINIKGELELGENVDKSILNQHLDEIIYFFQKTKFNVVVIEDLDRFRSTEIFTKLREINLLLNNSELIQRKIVFVYAIRDDMFQGKERIKFFDYIIPIIPFINPSNANDKLTELLEEEGLISVFSQSFIDDVVTFIDDIDMRLLTNIFQEYLVYKESLQHELTQDNLLAIVIYKNIYPRDFARLHKNEGDLYNFIANKDVFIKDFISKLDEEIALNQTVITNIEKDKIDNEKELRDVYIFALLSKLNNPYNVLIEGKDVTLDKLSEEDNFNALMDEQDIKYNSFVYNSSYRMYNPTKTSLGKSFSDVEKEINNRHTFSERIELINNLNDGYLEELKQQNEILDERKEEIKRWDIKRIFQNQDVSNYLGEFEHSLLMRSLLVNGYVNENYLDYISLFHEVSITKGDYTFIRNVKTGSSLDFDYKLEKLENVIKKINENHFEKVAILNYQIVEYILNNKNQYETRYKSLKKLLKSEHKIVIEFIDSYKRSNQTDNSILFTEIPKIWQGFWNFIVKKSNKFSEKKINEYFQLILTHSTLPDINKLNNIESFKQHFSVLSNLGDLIKDKNNTAKLKSIINSFNTKFNDISELHYNSEELYDLVLSNDYYEINTTNLLAIATHESVSENKFNSSNYTTIRNLDNEFTIAYIDKKIEIYVTSVLLALEENTSESAKSLILLLNNSDLTVMTKKLILESTLPVFQYLSEFDEIEIKEEILNQFAITPSWENVMDYFNSYENENLDSILINYLNNKDVFKELTKSNLSSLKDDDETKKKLALAIIYCDDLDLESHKSLRKCYHSSWSKLLAFEKLSYEKVESMIESKFITLSVNHYDKTKDNFSDLHIKFIERSFSTYIKAYDEYEMDEEDHSSILQSTILIDAQKKQFLDTLAENDIIENTVIATSATKVYVNEKVSGLSYSLLYGLFTKSNSNEYRIQLFNLNANSLDRSEAKNLIGQLGYPYNRLIKSRKQAKISSNPINLEFTNILLSLGIITSNREVKGMIKAVATA
ncbi:hypothetical protein BX611_1287 [Lutibacter oceani]|uniref:YobI-like P-loop NTPase domain-containing protein n=1 Tax=Lutibacter oceani TaxID=1853311 RepID=A0A3D9RVH0_9FLAO|nr:hypothetical protein [Lutibacter oceani]REE81751.1 hypothetical protein BX611_1287 [Lutibacter oceani]